MRTLTFFAYGHKSTYMNMKKSTYTVLRIYVKKQHISTSHSCMKSTYTVLRIYVKKQHISTSHSCMKSTYAVVTKAHISAHK